MSSDEKLIRIENKIDNLSDKIASIDVTLAAQHESLKYHIKRTDLLEKELTPIKKHSVMFQGMLKLLVYVGIVAGIIEAIVKLSK